MIITGIGSRETPDNIVQHMVLIGRWAKENGHWVRSGHAKGADQAFETGAQERCIAYLPWDGFEKDFISNAHKIIVGYNTEYHKITDRFHPNPSALSPAGRRLMNRNVCQIMGIKLNVLSDVVVCWTPDGLDSGGTGQALRLAQQEGLLIINMFYTGFQTSTQVIKFLTKAFE